MPSTRALLLVPFLLLEASLASTLPAAVPCPAGESCVPRNTCPRWQETVTAWKTISSQLTPGTPAYLAKLGQLSAAICNRLQLGVCCPRDTASDSLACEPASPNCLDLADNCGGADDSAAFVVGGDTTLPGEFPATALLGKIVTRRDRSTSPVVLYNETVWVCGGALISRWWVLTAAHCHTIKEPLGVVRLGEYQVTVGRGQDCLRDGSSCLPPVQDFHIGPGAVTVHPNYQLLRTQVHNDIALIRLPQVAELNRAVQVVCLPLDSVMAAVELGVADLESGLEGTRPTVVGWGHTDPLGRGGDSRRDKVASSRQQKLELPVLSAEDCSLLTPTETQLCAGGERGKDSCRGDSGGPLYLKRAGRALLESGHPWYLLGLVSFGTKLCGVGRPGIYTRVERFLPWVRGVVEGSGA